jgi:hypothetical protein
MILGNHPGNNFYTDEDLKWDNPPKADCLSIHLVQLTFGLSVTLPLNL